MALIPNRPSPAALRALARRDPALGRAMKRLPRFPGFPDSAANARKTHFASLAGSIVYQQLAGKAAATIHGRACALTPGSGFPKPVDWLALDDQLVRGAGLSAAKARAIRDLAERTLDGRLNLRQAKQLSNAELIERLVAVRGIGVWSAQMFLMFKLGRLDVLPIGDLGVQEGLRLLDELDERPKPKQLEARGEVWQPLASVAAWYMWRLTDEV